MIGGNGIKKVSKKDVIGELVNIAKMTWKSYENYIKNKSNENLESFRFYFNYFYNNNKEVAETDMAYGEMFSYPHFLYLKENYPEVANIILKIMNKKGIDLDKMEKLFLSIENDKETVL